MARSFPFAKVEKLIVEDPKLLFTLASYVLVLGIYVNSNLKSLGVGIMTFILYFSINGTFLANAFFKNEDVLFRMMFGVLLLVMLLGVLGWLTMIVYNLDSIRVALVLLITATLSSVLIKRMNRKDESSS